MIIVIWNTTWKNRPVERWNNWRHCSKKKCHAECVYSCGCKFALTSIHKSFRLLLNEFSTTLVKNFSSNKFWRFLIELQENVNNFYNNLKLNLPFNSRTHISRFECEHYYQDYFSQRKCETLLCFRPWNLFRKKPRESYVEIKVVYNAKTHEVHHQAVKEWTFFA